jgi:predicted nucleotidyltransferase
MNDHRAQAIVEPAADTIELHGTMLSRTWIAEFCRRHHIRRFALFGSILRDDFGPESDVDVLVEFEPGKTPGFAFFGMQDELSRHLGRAVDLNTRGFLSRYFRDQVEAGALALYEADGVLDGLLNPPQRP